MLLLTTKNFKISHLSAGKCPIFLKKNSLDEMAFNGLDFFKSSKT